MTSNELPSYKVNVETKEAGSDFAYLSKATENDMFSVQPPYLKCDWLYFWNDADFNCEAIIKLSFKKKILGLVRFALYPFDDPPVSPEFLEISHIECISKDSRIANPVGFWLIWYACQISITYCAAQDDEDLVKLDALESAIDYYENKVKMEGLGWTSHYRTGEDVYAFRFTRESAQRFCATIEKEYGFPDLHW